MTEALQLAIDALRTEYREVFLLYHEQALPYDEIAQILKHPVGTVKTWLHRARQQVQAELQRLGHMPIEGQDPP